MDKRRPMQYPGRKAVFENRRDAGIKLAVKLTEYKEKSVIVLAIPNGGLPLGMEVALKLDADLDIIISRKIPIPLMPEMGFGAVTDDGTVILNEELVRRLNMTREQINLQIAQVTANIRKRSLLYRGNRPLSIISGKTIIITDDGLASGYTMLAAIESVKSRRPKQIIVAVPVASEAAVSHVEKVTDGLVTCVTSSASNFYLADFYQVWHDLSDDEAMRCIREWRLRRLHPEMGNIILPRER
ncbi:MAG: phosphoribosyltransferase family protein [Chloroflexota bacterium]